MNSMKCCRSISIIVAWYQWGLVLQPKFAEILMASEVTTNLLSCRGRPSMVCKRSNWKTCFASWILWIQTAGRMWFPLCVGESKFEFIKCDLCSSEFSRRACKPSALQIKVSFRLQATALVSEAISHYMIYRHDKYKDTLAKVSDDAQLCRFSNACFHSARREMSAERRTQVIRQRSKVSDEPLKLAILVIKHLN